MSGAEFIGNVLRILDCDWSSDIACPPPSYWVEWGETNGRDVQQFAGVFCTAHTAALRAGQSPFEEWGWPVTIQAVRTVEAQLRDAADARGSWG